MIDFNNFTKRKQYTRQIKLELIPEGNTRKTISELKLLENDRNLSQLVQDTCPAIDLFLREVAESSLCDISYDFNMYADIYNQITKTTDYSERRSLYDKLEHIKHQITDVIVRLFNEHMPYSMSIRKLSEAEFLFDILPLFIASNTDMPEQDRVKYTDNLVQLKGMGNLFKKFTSSRIFLCENRIPKRSIENLELYIQNAKIIREYLDSAEEIPESYHISLLERVEISNYSRYISQNGIDEYNGLISGEFSSSGEKLQKGINEFLNELNNQNLSNPQYTGPIYRKLRPLYKQFFTEPKKSYSVAVISDEGELREVLKNTISCVNKSVRSIQEIFLNQKLLFTAQIEGRNLHMLSLALTGEHDTIIQNLQEVYISELMARKALPGLKKKEINAIQKEIDGAHNHIIHSIHSFSVIAEALSLSREVLALNILEKIQKLYKTAMNTKKVEILLASASHIKGKEGHVKICKGWLDSLIDFRSFVKLFIYPNSDCLLSDELEFYRDDLDVLVKNYNMIRNYITKSAGETATELTCCFGSPLKMTVGTWYNGRDKLYKRNNTIIRKGGKYYFFTLSPIAKPYTFNCCEEDTDCSVLFYKKGTASFKQIPKVLFSDAKKFFKENKEENIFVMSRFVSEPVVISRKVFEIYESKSFRAPGKNASEEEKSAFRENLSLYLQLCKRFCENYLDYGEYNMGDIPDVSTFKNSNDFFSEIDTRLVSMRWMNIRESELDLLVEKGEGLLFLINNRNMYKEGKKQTSYAKILLNILDEENCKNPKLKLNSTPAVRYREPLCERKITHKAGSMVVNRKDREGNRIPDHIHHELYYYYNRKISKKELSEYALRYVERNLAIAHVTAHDLIKNRRFTEEKFIIHLSYTVNNEVATDTSYAINSEINEMVEDNDNYNILTFSRGVEDLIYYILSDSQGKILKHGDLNTLNGVNYHELLSLKYKQGTLERENWNYTKSSKLIKDAYIKDSISLVIKMALENNALIVLENIATSRKNKYLYLDNQIFNSFENRLVEKLKNISFKHIPAGNIGSFDNPIQIAPQNNGYHKGLLYLVRSNNTQNRCPETGFLNRFFAGNYKTITAKRNFLSLFDSIQYDFLQKRFCYAFSYVNFSMVSKEKNGIQSDTCWQVFSHNELTLYDKQIGKWENVETISDRLLKLLPDAVLQKEENTTELIHSVSEMDSKAISYLFDIFFLAVYGEVYDRKTGKTGYISPITGVFYNNISYVKTQNLLHDFLEHKSLLRIESTTDPGQDLGHKTLKKQGKIKDGEVNNC